MPGAGEGFLTDADRNMSCHGRVEELGLGFGSLEYGTNSMSRTVFRTQKDQVFAEEERESSFEKINRERERANEELTQKQQIDSEHEREIGWHPFMVSVTS